VLLKMGDSDARNM